MSKGQIAIQVAHCMAGLLSSPRSFIDFSVSKERTITVLKCNAEAEMDQLAQRCITKGLRTYIHTDAEIKPGPRSIIGIGPTIELSVLKELTKEFKLL